MLQVCSASLAWPHLLRWFPIESWPMNSFRIQIYYPILKKRVRRMAAKARWGKASNSPGTMAIVIAVAIGADAGVVCAVVTGIVDIGGAAAAGGPIGSGLRSGDQLPAALKTSPLAAGRRGRTCMEPLFEPVVQTLRLDSKEAPMLKWAVIFFLISIVAGALGFSGGAQGAAGIAKILFVLFLILAIVFLVLLFAGIAVVS